MGDHPPARSGRISFTTSPLLRRPFLAGGRLLDSRPPSGAARGVASGAPDRLSRCPSRADRPDPSGPAVSLSGGSVGGVSDAPVPGAPGGAAGGVTEPSECGRGAPLAAPSASASGSHSSSAPSPSTVCTIWWVSYMPATVLLSVNSCLRKGREPRSPCQRQSARKRFPNGQIGIPRNGL